MRKFIVLLILNLPALLGAQPFVLPPNAAENNVVTKPAGINGGANLWGSSSTLGAYRISSDDYQKTIIPGAIDQELALTWNSSAPASLSANLQQINATGGTVRAIFVGETADWLNAFGYSYSGQPSGPGSYTAWSQIQSSGSSPNIQFGDHFDVSLAQGQAANFDFWFNATGVSGPPSIPDPELGGVYTAFNPSLSSVSTSQYVWTASSIPVNTWLAANAASQPVDTFLVGIEDWRLDRSSDADFNDFRFALQFFNSDGTPITAVPEPALGAALIGILALGFVLLRRQRTGHPA